ncbi:MAG TPA: hypothetical protein VJT31_25750 [Rugosimonospora sp.]|nr:hypothetical protein [Rugosimonospora sp.]
MHARVLTNRVDRRLILLVIALAMLAFVAAAALGPHHGPAAAHAATAIEYGLLV